MTRLSGIAQTIVNYFRLLWTTFVGMWVPRDEAPSHSQDIESGIRSSEISPAKFEKDIVIDIKQASIPVQVPAVPEDVDLESETIVCDHPIRKPSRRASAVDPVKARILDATLKHVQDKKFNVVKAVVIQPPVIAVPYSAKIEYYNPRAKDTIISVGSTIHIIKDEPRVVQFVFPPVIVDDCAASNDTECTSMSSSTSSLGDLFDLFPAPPTYIPKPPPAGTRVTEESKSNISSEWFTSPVTAVEDPADADCSDSESVGSSYSTALLSDETADTSLPSSPASVSALILSADCAVAKRHVNSDTASNALLDEVAVRAALTAQEYRHDLLPTIKDKSLVKHSLSPVESFSKADLHESHANDVALKRKISAYVARPDIADVLKTSPIRANLFVRSEYCFEVNHERFTPVRREEDIIFAPSMSPDRISFPVCKVAPLRIVKKNNPITVNPFPENSDGPVNHFTTKWERSTDYVRKTFKDIDVQDTDFYSIFYRDGSLSQTSPGHTMHGSTEGSASCESGASFSMCNRPKDGGLGSVEQSTEVKLSSDVLAGSVSTGKTFEQALLGPFTPVLTVVGDVLPSPLQMDPLESSLRRDP